ncbi:MAG TPA: hypothetical protein VGD64_01685 [Acidisarcina sp.]
MTTCTDPVVGDILSSWRYDISGIAPGMRTDYEQHLFECAHCRSRQRLHRTIDVTLIGLSTLSVCIFVLALAVIHHLHPVQHWAVPVRQMHIVLTLQIAAVFGLLLSLLAWVLVAITTPAPLYLTGMALAQARVLQGRLPEELRDRLQRTVL